MPEGDFGSDVEGIKPILFDVGKGERKMEEALDYCRKELADKGLILYDLKVPPQINKTISDGGITVDFWIIKVHTSN